VDRPAQSCVQFTCDEALHLAEASSQSCARFTSGGGGGAAFVDPPLSCTAGCLQGGTGATAACWADASSPSISLGCSHCTLAIVSLASSPINSLGCNLGISFVAVRLWVSTELPSVSALPAGERDLPSSLTVSSSSLTVIAAISAMIVVGTAMGTGRTQREAGTQSRGTLGTKQCDNVTTH
jgi:hypothetical protein